MDWHDRGILLDARIHGETSAILEIFTSGHGRHAGVLRGGMSRRYRPILQPGTQLTVEWRARLAEHIGTFRIEPLHSPAALFSDRLALSALSSICAVLMVSLPERESFPECYQRTMQLLSRLESLDEWFADYLQWEIELLAETGFGLDLTSCAATGTTDDLVYVSPKSGRAVSRHGAGRWVDRMLPLPPCFLGSELGGLSEMADGLHTIGHFLQRSIHRHGHDGAAPLPKARTRFANSIRQLAEQGR